MCLRSRKSKQLFHSALAEIRVFFIEKEARKRGHFERRQRKCPPGHSLLKKE
jgi:hypothetical protein